MIAFCTHCWAEIAATLHQCPSCGADLNGDTRSYKEKLIGALAHPLPQARARICWLIGENGIASAVPRLMHLAEEDPDLFVRRAAVEGLRILQGMLLVARFQGRCGSIACGRGEEWFERIRPQAPSGTEQLMNPEDAGVFSFAPVE